MFKNYNVAKIFLFYTFGYPNFYKFDGDTSFKSLNGINFAIFFCGAKKKKDKYVLKISLQYGNYIFCN